MVFKKFRPRRTKRTRKINPRRKQYYGRRTGIKQPVQYFKRTYYQPQFIQLTPGLVATGAAYTFTLSGLPSASDFTALYDQYMIKGVKISLIPKHSEVIASSSVTQGNVHSVIDYDDSNTPPDLDTLLQYQNYKSTRMNLTHTRYFKPKVLHEIYRSSVSTGYAPKSNTWLDIAANTIPHYGIKFWFDALPLGSATLYYDVKCTMYLAMKNVR